MFSQAIDSPQPQNTLRDLLEFDFLENMYYISFLKFRALFLLAVKMNNMNNGYINRVLMYIPVNKVTFMMSAYVFATYIVIVFYGYDISYLLHYITEK